METRWASELDAGKTVEVEIIPLYKGDLRRPHNLYYVRMLEEKSKHQSF